MASGITRTIADWVASVSYDDLPSTVREKTRVQVASMLGAVFAGARTDVGAAVARAARTWGSGDDASVLPEGTRAPAGSAAYVNATRSVALDFDDYLFAGHTGHSAVLASLALGERDARSGADVMTAIVVANEVAGRLGAAFLLGPHNGQMWTYIHALGAACAAAKLAGLDAERTAHAIGIALAQPPYPLAPAFFGPDSKATMAAEPLAAGMRAATLAAEGMTGAADVLGGDDGMLARMATRPFRFVFSGFGDAWLTESLTYKLYPGCAYVDTAVDAFEELRARFASRAGRSLTLDDVRTIRVEATVFTCGMEAMGYPHRVPGLMRAIDVNFSVGLSLGVLLACGRIDAETLSRSSLAEHHDEIDALAQRVSLELDPELTGQVGGLDTAGIDLGAYLSEGREPESLAGADLSKFEMRFPARVTLETTEGTDSAEVSIPRGGAGRPWEETLAGVREKFLSNAAHLGETAAPALDRVLRFDDAGDIRDVVASMVAGR